MTISPQIGVEALNRLVPTKEKITLALIAIYGAIVFLVKKIIFKALEDKSAARKKAAQDWRISEDEEEISREETSSCSILYNPPVGTPITADFVFVHGFLGNSEYTWRQEKRRWTSYKYLKSDHDSKSEKETEEHERELELRNEGEEETCVTSTKTPCWPRDWLPQDIPDARVIALDYLTDRTFFYWRLNKRRPRRTNLKERAEEMIKLLKEQGVGQRPIIWCAHSKGGLYIKQILVNVHDSGRPEDAGLVDFTRGFLFMSVPHRGTTLGVEEKRFLGVSVEIREVRTNSPKLLELHKRFLELYKKRIRNAKIVNTVETVPAWIGLKVDTTTSIPSADIGLGPLIAIGTKHADTCKPSSRPQSIYRR